MGKNPIVAVVAVIIVVVAVIYMFRGGGKDLSSSVAEWNWYDTGTSELYGDASPELSPIQAPSGKDGVKAYVFSCTSCEDKGSRFIGYLEKYTDEDKAAIASTYESGNMGARTEAYNNAKVRGENDTEWVVKSSAEGADVVASANAECAPQSANSCAKYMP